ncbi:MAG: hypothetical protein K2L01_02555 [Rikenellaceae bacterium]|nr:hypothetical protein [Rikenellaceae bacterium]
MDKEKIHANNEEQEIDLLELGRKLWAKRRFITRYTIYGFVAGVIISLSIPKEYTTSILMTPETSDAKNNMGGMAGLASLAGINIGGSGDMGITEDIYPQIIESTPFLMEFYGMPVTTSDEEPQTYTLSEYLGEEQKTAWWNHILRVPGAIIKLIKGNTETSDKDTVDLFNITPKQEAFVFSLAHRLSATKDKTSGLYTLTAEMQDPLVSAVVADSLLVKLQRYMAEYKTGKVKQDLDYNIKLYEDAQAEYNMAEDELSLAMDRNRNILSEGLKSRIERLKNERDLKYDIYRQAAQQVALLRFKLQENTPIATIIEPSKVPLRATSPKKTLITLAITFLSFIVAAGIVLLKDIFSGSLKHDTETKDIE